MLRVLQFLRHVINLFALYIVKLGDYIIVELFDEQDRISMWALVMLAYLRLDWTSVLGSK